MSASANPIHAADLLNRAAQEIALCRAMVSTVEQAVEQLHLTGTCPDLQGIDLLHQMLDDIAALLRALADTHSFAPLVIEDAEPLLMSLRLGAVRARLRNPHTEFCHAKREHDVELF